MKEVNQQNKNLNNLKWSPAIYDLMYSKLYEEFGIFEGNRTQWLKGREEEFNNFISNFSEIITKISGKETSKDAVKNQIDFVINKQKVFSKQGSVRGFLHNMFYAYKHGFIRFKNLPHYILLQYNEDENNGDKKQS